MANEFIAKKGLIVEGNSTLATVISGTWNGGAIPVLYGGTGSTTAAAALTALGAEAVANKNVANGYAGLDGTGKVAAAQLPSYVDDILEYANLAAFPATGVSGVIYVALDTNKIYRWGTSAYVEVSAAGVSWGAISGTLSNQTDLQTALNGKEASITAGTTAQYWRGDKSWQTLNAAAVGLTNVTNNAQIYSLNGLTAQTQTFATPGTTGTAPNWSSATSAHTLNIPLASATSVTAGLISKSDYDNFNSKQAALTGGSGIVKSVTGNISYISGTSSQLIAADGTLVTLGTNLSITAGTLNAAGGAGITDGDKGDITVSSTGSVWTIDAGVVTLAKMSTLAANSIIGNNTGTTATPLALTGTQVTAMLDSFAGSTKGLVPVSVGGTTNFLRADGSWSAPSGGGGSNTVSFNRITATNQTLILSDAGNVVELNSASAITINIPTNTDVDFPIGTQIIVTQYGAGVATIAASSGVVINSSVGTSSAITINARYSAATLVKVGTDEWYVYGGIKASSGINTVTLTTQTQLLTTTTYTNITGLSFDVASGKKYYFKFVILYTPYSNTGGTTAAAGTGARFSVTGPASPTALTYNSYFPSGATAVTITYNSTTYGAPAVPAASATANTNMAIIEGVITASANSTVTATGATETTTTSVRPLIGSFVNYQMLN